MLNLEKYYDELISKKHEGFTCNAFFLMYPKRTDCVGTACTTCKEAVKKWLLEEYKPQIDWSKVPVDTPVITDVGNRHFCKYENDRVYTFDDGTTSWTYRSEYGWTTPRVKTTVQLALPEDIEKYSI